MLLTAFPCGARPSTSSLNVVDGAPVANAAAVALSGDGKLCLYSSVTAHLIIDVNGWWN